MPEDLSRVQLPANQYAPGGKADGEEQKPFEIANGSRIGVTSEVDIEAGPIDRLR